MSSTKQIEQRGAPARQECRINDRLVALSRFGEPRISMLRGDWHSSIELKLPTTGATLDIRSGFNHPSPVSALTELEERVREVLSAKNQLLIEANYKGGVMNNLETLQFGELALLRGDGTKEHCPQIEIHTAQSPAGWIWAISIRIREFGYGYHISNPKCLEKAVDCRQEAVRKASIEVLGWIKGRKVDGKMKDWLHSLCEQQLDLFEGSEVV